ncbi:response regulator [Sandaracinobacter sp. RS1-74]|uniref:response regulator n=1 Tax=Sandaracinobacteroides sayramensis TaxID=2913411 RepID=UPI001EDAE740|nr:response regulator [Sandaracinobacteroides sayramensis]
MPNILLVDDDPGIRDLVSDFLGRHGYDVTTAEDGAAMDRAIAAAPQPFDLIVLDLMMPGEHGLEIARRLAGPGGPAIIMLSAMGEDSDRIVGLEVGADDYLPKPCNPRELLARIRAVLRRRTEPAAAEPQGGLLAEFDGWKLDLVRRELSSPENVLISLSDGEFSLLRVFVERPQQPLAREDLLDLARGKGSESYDRSIDVQISRLRRKLDSATNSHDELIRTVRNEGYMFTPKVVRR